MHNQPRENNYCKQQRGRLSKRATSPKSKHRSRRLSVKEKSRRLTRYPEELLSLPSTSKSRGQTLYEAAAARQRDPSGAEL